ncbi:MAG: hypothetical protein LKJ47_05255 [Bifidobacteriaceae bacterium]|jgi:hypothetical protein|nr:hypothetical protein [Bifidobacteriaceae bacterium]
MNDDVIQVVRFRETNALHLERRLYKNSPPVRMSISFCDPRDRSAAECIQLAEKSCRVAFHATDVARGRLQPSMLKREMTAILIEQILNIDAYLTIHHNFVDKKTLLFTPHLPIQICGLQGTIIHPDRFDACISMKIGAQNHCVNVVLCLVGSRWICTEFQLA